MAQVGIQYTLETPGGTLTIHGEPFAGDGFRLANVLGLDGEALRVPIEARPMSDGAVVHDGWSGAKYPILVGHIRASAAGGVGDLTTRNQLESELRSKLRTIRRSDGILRWTPSGYSARRLVVRLLDQVTITRPDGMAWREFQIPLVAADPRIYSDTLHTLQTTALQPAQGAWVAPYTFPFSFGDVSSGGTLTVDNEGDSETPPVLRLYGPCKSPRIVNTTTGLALSLRALALVAGDFVEIDCSNHTVTLNGSSDQNLLGVLDITSSEFFMLEPGDNVLQYTAIEFQSGALAEVEWRDGWAGG